MTSVKVEHFGDPTSSLEMFCYHRTSQERMSHAVSFLVSFTITFIAFVKHFFNLGSQTLSFVHMKVIGSNGIEYNINN